VGDISGDRVVGDSVRDDMVLGEICWVDWGDSGSDSGLNAHFINETSATCFIMERLNKCSWNGVWIGDYGGSESGEETLFDSGVVQGSGYS
jgi:hypothetical protein